MEHLRTVLKVAQYANADGLWVEVPTKSSGLVQDVPLAADGRGSGLHAFMLTAAPAEEWQVSWLASAADITAAQVLQGMHINPNEASAGWRHAAAQLGIEMEPLPGLAAHTTLVVVADRGSLAFLAPARCSSSCQEEPLVMLDPVAELTFSGAHLALRQHGEPLGGLTADATFVAGLQYLDSMIMSLSTIMEPVRIDLRYESAYDGVIPQTQGKAAYTERLDLKPQVAPNSQWLRSQTGILSSARPPPCASGALIAVEAIEQPVIINVSELVPHDLRRLLHLFSYASDHLPPPPPMQILNSTGHGLVMRQVGTTGREMQLPHGGALRDVNWFVPPWRGAECAVQLALQPAAGSAGVVWSDPVEVGSLTCGLTWCQSSIRPHA